MSKSSPYSTEAAVKDQPKVKYAEGKLDKSQIQFMRLIEKQNFERVEKLKKVRKNNLITALLLGSGVISIYAYSMLSVKQERFLDDFEEPKKISNTN